jgi:hypothetical protein
MDFPIGSKVRILLSPYLETVCHGMEAVIIRSDMLSSQSFEYGWQEVNFFVNGEQQNEEYWFTAADMEIIDI